MNIGEQLSGIASEIAPKNMDEFNLGMHLATLMDVISSGEPCNLNELMSGCDEALDYWFDKYDDVLSEMPVASDEH